MREVQEFIEGLAADERIIVKRLRDLILDADPRIVEKLSYGVPYFFPQQAIVLSLACLGVAIFNRQETDRAKSYNGLLLWEPSV